jgi:hypothetical protein
MRREISTLVRGSEKNGRANTLLKDERSNDIFVEIGGANDWLDVLAEGASTSLRLFGLDSDEFTVTSLCEMGRRMNHLRSWLKAKTFYAGDELSLRGFYWVKNLKKDYGWLVGPFRDRACRPRHPHSLDELGSRAPHPKALHSSKSPLLPHK